MLYVLRTDRFKRFKQYTTLTQAPNLLFNVVYRTEEGQPFVLPVVRTIEAQMSADPTLNHDYIAPGGLDAFTDAASRLLLGNSSLAVTQNRV